MQQVPYKHIMFFDLDVVVLGLMFSFCEREGERRAHETLGCNVVSKAYFRFGSLHGMPLVQFGTD